MNFRLNTWGFSRRRRPALLLTLIVGLACALRITALDRHFFWIDESFLFDSGALAQHRNPFSFASEIWRETTYNPLWAVLVWLVTRWGGMRLWIARLPSCAAGVLAVLMMFAAARRFRLDRPTALAAALLMALCWPQVEYSQQILPYAGIPFLTALVLWCLGGLTRPSEARSAGALWGWSSALAAACALHLLNHNSFLVLLPFLAFSLAWFVGGQLAADRGKFPVQTWLATASCLALIVAVSIPFFLAKQGEGYRGYLAPYYLSSFRDHSMGYIPCTDWLYFRWVPRPHELGDGVYFMLSRAYGTLSYCVNLFSPIYVTPLWGLLAGVPVALVVAGTVHVLRGQRGGTLRGLGLGLVLTLMFVGLLSTRRLFPFGGIRQLLVLTPLVILVAAIGWRALVRRRPRAVWAATFLVLALYAVRVPVYYTGTATRIDARTLENAVKMTGAHTVVLPQFGEHLTVLNYHLRGVTRKRFFDAPSRRFRDLVLKRESFLLFTTDLYALEEFQKRPDARGLLFKQNIDHIVDMRSYEVRLLLAQPGGPFRGGQPNPGAFLYFLRPKAGATPVVSYHLVGAVVPGPGAQTPATQSAPIEILFDEPIDPATVTPNSVELLACQSDGGGEGPRAVPARLTLAKTGDRLILQPSAPLLARNYLIAVRESLRGLSGHQRAGPFYSTFQVVPASRDERAAVPSIASSLLGDLESKTTRK